MRGLLQTDRSVCISVIVSGFGCEKAAVMVRTSKRQAILEAAVTVLSKRGLEGFSASSLAEAAGVGKATLFHHFPSLDDVIFESFEQFSMGMDIIAPPEGMSFGEWLRGLGDASFGLDEVGGELARAYFVFIGRALFDEKLRKKVLGTVTAANDAFCGIVDKLHPGPLGPEERTGARNPHIRDRRRHGDPSPGLSRTEGGHPAGLEPVRLPVRPRCRQAGGARMRAIVAGAGIAGLATAYELGTSGWDVTVLERAKGLRDSGYMIDFFGPGYDAAEENGLLERFARHAHSIEGVELVNADGGRQAYMPYEAFRASLGGRLFSLMRGDIERELFAALPSNVEVRYDSEVAMFHDTRTRVDLTLGRGERLEADLLVGADGLHSRLRRQFFSGEGDALKFLGFHTAAYVFKSADVARVARDKFVMLSLPNRQAGFYRMHDDQVAVYFIWRNPRPERDSGRESGDRRAVRRSGMVDTRGDLRRSRQSGDLPRCRRPDRHREMAQGSRRPGRRCGLCRLASGRAGGLPGDRRGPCPGPNACRA